HAHALLYRAWYETGFEAETIREHEAVIDAIAARDPEMAAKSMRAHLEKSRRRFLAVATTRGQAPPSL
ncbi:MAG TPA: FCD domain-containing protein, partial [Acidimicrobiales bacterium]|nr:FCD domain-containing protein [Acidimicrobiales bacterium]